MAKVQPLSTPHNSTTPDAVKKFPKQHPDNPDLNGNAPKLLKEKDSDPEKLPKDKSTGSDDPGKKSADKDKSEKSKYTKIGSVQAFIDERYKVRYNTFSHVVEYTAKGVDAWREVDERAALRFESELLHKGKTDIQRALHLCLFNSEEFDPIQSYFDRLPKWDGQTDYIEQLANFVKVAPGDRHWFNLMFKKHLLRTIACSIDLIPFNKHTFVLVSERQNLGKTSFIRYLCPPALKAYYTEDIDFDNKDGLTVLARNIFINLDELRNLSKQDINKVKSFISKDSVKLRLPFDRRDTSMTRKASFFGSTNNAEFLTDETGNVRWLIFEIEGINHDEGGQNGYHSVDINMVWSQAYAMLKQGFRCQLTREEIEQSEQRNSRNHLQRPIECDLILKYFDFSEDKADFQTTADIVIWLQERSLSRNITTKTVGRALTILKVAKVSQRIRKGADPVKGYLLKKRTEQNPQWDIE
jgi:predicted P-loop ATPase